jgi:hypothetical protein
VADSIEATSRCVILADRVETAPAGGDNSLKLLDFCTVPVAPEATCYRTRSSVGACRNAREAYDIS